MTTDEIYEEVKAIRAEFAEALQDARLAQQRLSDLMSTLDDLRVQEAKERLAERGTP